MELALGVRVPAGGARADVLVRAPDGACLGDVADQLLARVLPAGASGRLTCAGRPVPPESLLGVPPLVTGALLEVDGRAAAVPPGPVVLHVVGGPSAGTVLQLSSGALVVGRGEGAGLRLDDPDASREHCRLVLTDGAVRVEDLGSTNGTLVEGVPVGPSGADLRAGALLAVGASRLLVAGAAVPGLPAEPVGDGVLAVNRPPRVRPPVELVQVVVPEPPAERERGPLPVLAVLAPVVLGVVMWRVTGSTTFLLFTLLSPVLAVGQVVTERRTGRRRSRRETALWRARRDVAERTLRAAVAADVAARRAAAPDPAEVLLTALGPGPRLWERRREDDDALALRLGLADLPARVEAEGDVPPGAATAADVPAVVALGEVGVLGLAGPRDEAQALARWLVVQAAALHSPRDLQLVVLAETAAAGAWEWTRWLPHLRPDEDADCRALLGLGADQAAVRVGELAALVAARRSERASASQGARTDERPVLVVVDGARALRAVPGLAALLADGPAVGVHAVCVDDDPHRLPEECGATAVLQGTAVAVRVQGRPEVVARADRVDAAWAEAVARALAPLRDGSRDRGGAQGLPAAVRWTDLAELPLDGSAEDASRVLERWSSPGRSTTALLGQGPDGALAVDLVRDGPHALVAGTTGSGKSELLQTALASLALVNRPDELVLVLVDYKGGAAFGPCARLPHTVGMVTDLDGALVERALASLTAELSRREAVLAEVGAKDIGEHRRRVGRPGGPTGVLPRLLIVVDEFASLAEELPDLLTGLVGIAQRGRSLGVHLVLATQRPEGVVSADIRANANLRLCLAVTRDTESRDVLDSPVAATISRRTPGRAYVRTGHADLTPFQAARVGGRRPAVVRAEQKATVELLPTAELGDPPPRAATSLAEEETTDLSLLVDACVAAAARLGLPPARSPWLAPLPAVVALPSTAGAFGLVDLPSEQARRPLLLDLERSTHLMVVGAARSGRTTALRAVAVALARSTSADDLHLYGVDAGGGGLAALTALPHTGAVAGRDAPARVDRLLSWLAEEVARRSALLTRSGWADVAEQRAAAPVAERLPRLVLLLDRWEAFLATFQDVDAGRLVDLVLQLLREGPAVGLHVVVSADRSGIVGRIASSVEEKLLLRLADRGDYAAAGLPVRLVPDDLPPGRGWLLRPGGTGAPPVVQVAHVEREALLGLDLPEARYARPHRVEPLPVDVPRSSLPLATGPGRAVVGVGGDELEPVELHLDAGLLVAGPPGSGRSSALLLLAAGLTAGGLRVVPVAPRPSPLRDLPGCLTGRDDPAAVTAALADGPCALLVDDAELLVDSPLAGELERAVREARDRGSVVVAAGTTEELVTGYRGFVVDLRRSRSGLLLSPQSSADGDLLGVRLSRSTGGPVVPGRALLVRRGAVLPVQLARPGS